MTFDQMYEAMVQQNPALAKGTKLHLSPESFRKALSVAYSNGYEEGETYGRIARSLEESDNKLTGELP